MYFTPVESVATAEIVTGELTVAPFAGEQITTVWFTELGAHEVVEVPEPLSETVCGLLASESVSVRAPVRVPVAVGVKVTETEQLAPAASEVPQLLVCAKSPPATMELKLTAVAPPLLTLTDFGAAVVPIA